jgi:uncharacterized iron-regulated membrane protein
MKMNLSSLSSLKKMFAYGDRIRPARDWFVLLTVFIFLLLVGIAWNVFLFTQFANEVTTNAATAAPAQLNASSSIVKVQTIFQQRATEENNYQQNYHFVDPSTPGS